MVSEVTPRAAAGPGTAVGRARTAIGGSVPSWLSVVGRRVFISVPLLFVVSALSFLLLSLAPGNAADTIVGTGGTPAQYAAVRRQLGLDQPVYIQYWRWLRLAVRGDLGTSVVSGQSVAQELLQRVPVSVSLIVGALVVTLLAGVGLGVLSAVRGGVTSRLVDSLSLAGFALPTFWVGAVLIELFAVRFRWFPAVGYVSPAQSPGQWFRSLVLPVVALALGSLATVAKNTREAMLDVLASEHIRMAWANGVPARSIFFVYALKNAAIRIVTLLGLLVVGLLGGTVLVETVFALPGLGSLLVTGVTQHDVPVVQGIAVCFTVIVVLVNLVVDLACTWLDPRVRQR